MAIVTLSVASTSALAALELYSGGYTAAEDTNGFKFLNDGKTRFYIKNADDGACTATIDTPQPCSYGGTTIHDTDLTITNAKDYVIGPFAKSRYNDADGYVTISITPNTDATAISAKAIKSTF
jgi:hypothetical protein